jgi:Heterokaryon incompatibility protein (HET)
MDTAYIYRPLSTPRSFRVIEILPAWKYDATIQISLKEVFLGNGSISSLPFEALSYVWGSPVGSKPVFVEGQTVLVTANCDAALRRIRRRRRKRVLWVDALCTNQADIAERNEQVKLMGELFSQATRVLVWLGGPPGCTPASIKFNTRYLLLAPALAPGGMGTVVRNVVREFNSVYSRCPMTRLVPSLKPSCRRRASISPSVFQRVRMVPPSVDRTRIRLCSGGRCPHRQGDDDLETVCVRLDTVSGNRGVSFRDITRIC